MAYATITSKTNHKSIAWWCWLQGLLCSALGQQSRKKGTTGTSATCSIASFTAVRTKPFLSVWTLAQRTKPATS